MLGKRSEKFFFCLDPDSQLYYLLKYEGSSVYLLDNVPEKFKGKAEQAIKILRILSEYEMVGDRSTQEQDLTLPNIKWNFKTKSVSRFRRLRLPNYLLHKDYSSFPMYKCDSNLSLAFALQKDDLNDMDDSKIKATIRIIINTQDYLSQLAANEAKENRDINEAEEITIEIDALLVSSADAAIKALLKEIFKEYKKNIRPKEEGNKFALKCSGYREYLIGGTPLLSYDRIRICLRNGKPFHCILAEVPKTVTLNTQFPPIVDISLSEEKKINFDEYINCPLLMWYPPQSISFKPAQLEDLITRKFYLKDQLLKPRALTHQRMPKFLDKRLKQIINSNFETQPLSIYSGECDFPFRIRINGIDKIINLVKLFLSYATDNGLLQPSYITLKNKYKKKDDSEENHDEKKSKKKKTGEIREVAPPIKKLNNVHNLPHDYKESILERDYFNEHINISHTNYKSQSLINLAEILDLPFIPYQITCEVSLLIGSNLLREDLKLETFPVPFSDNPRWYQWLKFPKINISQLPLETKIAMNIKIYSQNGESMIIGCVQKNLFDEKAIISGSTCSLNLWPFYSVDPRLSCFGEFEGMIIQNSDIFNEQSKITIQFDHFEYKMLYTLRDQRIMDALSIPNYKSQEERSFDSIINDPPNSTEMALCNKLISKDPLNWTFSEEEKRILLKCRKYVKKATAALPIFLCAINWFDPDQVNLGHELLETWGKMSPEDALCLLDAHYGDEMVRLYAVTRIGTMTDDTLSLFMPELVMALLYETQHFSPLGELLIERSLKNPSVVGHEFFWLIRSQLHLKASLERYVLILEKFLMLCGNYKDDLLNENRVNNFLYCVAKDVFEAAQHVNKKEDESAKKNLLAREIMHNHQENKISPYAISGKFAFPHDSRLESLQFNYKKCKVMNSKKAPLWVETINSQINCSPLLSIFKKGDDLRQDILTLQLIRIMDKIWLDNGLDYKMKPYRVMATMDQVGFIEIVTESQTTAYIHVKYGGKVGGAFKENTIKTYLQEYNKGPALEKAIEYFKRSCAAYCVATYILGIGDRHPDNIMVTKEGHLFHIDFGHFLGNFKKKFGIERERTGFVIQNAMAYVVGAKTKGGFDDFLKRCTTAYNLIRKNANIFVNIFQMMISAGMPELKHKKHIEFLTDKRLFLELTDQEASERFKKELDSSINDTWRNIDNLFHNIKRQ